MAPIDAAGGRVPSALREAGCGDGPSPAASGTPSAHDWAMVAVLAAAMCLAYVDRQLAAVLAQPIKAQLGLSDTQLSLVVGLAFAGCQVAAMIPFSVIADRFDRVRLIGAGIFVWSAMTVYCGFAERYWELFIGRMGVGLGEAALIPAAMSLIGERFEGHRRATAITCFLAAIPIGLGLAAYGGGWLVEAFGALHAQGRLPGFAPWQATFVVVGISGFLISALTLTIAEPRRSAHGRVRWELGPGSSDDSLIGFLRQHWQILVPVFVACALMNACVNGILAWSPSLLARSLGWTPVYVGTVLGAYTVAFGLLGSLAGGSLAANLTRRTGRDPSLKIVMTAAAVLLPATTVGVLLSNGTLIGLSLGVTFLCMFAFSTVAPLSVVGVTPERLRARVYALFLVVNGLAGPAFGPTLYALFTDFVLRNPLALGKSIAAVSVLLLVPALVALLIAQRAYGEWHDGTGWAARATAGRRSE